MVAMTRCVVVGALSWGCSTGGIVVDDDTALEPKGCAGVVVNEVRSNGGDPIEFFNPTNEAIDLWGCVVTDGGGNSPYTFFEGSVIEAGEFLVIEKDVDFTFGLGASDAVRLVEVDGTLLDQTAWATDGAIISWCRYPDGGQWTQCARGTFGYPNVLEYPAVVVPPLYVAGLGQWNQAGVRVDEPNEVTIDGNGRVWAGDQFNFRVQVFNVDGSFNRSVGGVGNGPGQFVNRGWGQMGPEGMRIGPDGFVYAVDRGGGKVNVYNPNDFSFVRAFGAGQGYVDLVGLEVTSDGTVFVADQGTDIIDAWTLTGTWLYRFDTTRPGGGQIFTRVETLAADEVRGRLLATNEDIGTIEAFDLATGTWLDMQTVDRQSGGNPEPGRVANVVEGIFIDPANQWLFVSDEQNQRFMVHDISAGDLLFDPVYDYAFMGAFGRAGTGPGEFISADGVAVSAVHDRIAVADQGNNRIQVFALSDVIAALSLQ